MLPEFGTIIEQVKKAALEAVNASNPVAVCFGEVISTEPLKINVFIGQTPAQIEVLQG